MVMQSTGFCFFHESVTDWQMGGRTWQVTLVTEVQGRTRKKNEKGKLNILSSNHHRQFESVPLRFLRGLSSRRSPFRRVEGSTWVRHRRCGPTQKAAARWHVQHRSTQKQTHDINWGITEPRLYWSEPQLSIIGSVRVIITVISWWFVCVTWRN